MGKKELQNLIFGAILLFTLTPSLVLGDCTCEQEENEGNKTKALKFKLIALASILVAGGIGVSLPFVGKFIPALRPEKDGFFVVKAFAAGVILATGFIHILPDAFENLTSPCLKEHPWADFPFTGFVAMVATIATLLFETSSAAYQLRAQSKAEMTTTSGDEEKHQGHDGNLTTNIHGHDGHLTMNVHEHVHRPVVNKTEKTSAGGDKERHQGHDGHSTTQVHGHTRGPMLSTDVHGTSGLSQVQRYRIVSKVLELGIIVHSVIIGLSLGASQSSKTIKPLIVALSFHQFFEGLGLGGCIFQAKIKSLAVTIMGAFFALTTPSGIVIGILVSNTYKENSSTALIVEGVLNAASAGILIYMALVDLLSQDFMNPRMQNNMILQFFSNVSLLLGAGFMSLLAKWA